MIRGHDPAIDTYLRRRGSDVGDEIEISGLFCWRKDWGLTFEWGGGCEEGEEGEDGGGCGEHFGWR